MQFVNMGWQNQMGVQGGGRRPPPKHAEMAKFLCEAIKGHEIVQALYRGQKIIFEPYAVFEADAQDLLLTAVVLQADDVSLNSFAPQDVVVSDLSDQKTAGLKFIPSRAFDPAAPIYAGRKVKCIIEFT